MHSSGPSTISLLLVGWCAGVLATVATPWLPGVVAGLFVMAALLTAALWRRWWFMAASLGGAAFALVAVQGALQQRLQPCADGAFAVVTGRVVSLPARDLRQTRFELEVESWEIRAGCGSLRPGKVRLTWYRAPDIAPGERWRVLVRLRAPRGLVNAGAFDYERWLLANRIDATGSVQSGVMLDDGAGSRWGRWRLRTRDAIARMDLREGGILLALLTGDGALIDDERWRLFRATGTIHLMVISGLHLGLVGGLGMLSVRTLLVLFPAACVRWPARQQACIGALAAVTLYGFCAGWGLPVRRAWIMTVVGLVWFMLRRRVHPWYPFWIAMAVILAVEPLAPLAPGFWLSFGAVGVLLAWFVPRPAQGGTVRTLVRAQLILFFCMVPLLLATVGELPLLAPFANLAAVPVVTIAIVPLVLLGGMAVQLVPHAGEWLLQWPDLIAGGLVHVLREIAVRDGAQVVLDVGSLPVLVAFAGSGLLLLPLPGHWRVLALVLMAVLLPRLPPAPPFGEFRVRVLDVGQGLSVLVETTRHRAIFDAGPRYVSGFDLGETVVVPAVRRSGGRAVDILVLSHGHVDHTGGAEAIHRALRVRRWIAGAGFERLPDEHACRAGDRWQWDGVVFEILYPEEPRRLTANDGSCVLWIGNGSRSVVLPGDIEARAEAALVALGTPGAIDLLVAPHHGSRTSSTSLFLGALSPHTVVVSNGHRNRYGHPHDEVMARYRAIGARVYTTAESGAIVWDSAQPDRIIELRRARRGYWRAAGGAGPAGSVGAAGD
jgi:competence protein ComEC